MSVFHIFQIVQMVPNRSKHHYRQIREIPRLQSAQINFNNWILCMTESCQLHPSRNWAPHIPMGFSPPPPRRKKTQPLGHFFNFSPPPPPWESWDWILWSALIALAKPLPSRIYFSTYFWVYKNWISNISNIARHGNLDKMWKTFCRNVP